MRDPVVAAAIHETESSGVRYDGQGGEIAKTREGFDPSKLWDHIIANNQNNRLKRHMKCIGEPGNQCCEFRMSSRERQHALIAARCNRNKFTFNRFSGREIGQYRSRGPSVVQIPIIQAVICAQIRAGSKIEAPHADLLKRVKGLSNV